MGKGILLATKTLVESIRHYIRDPSAVFSVCHAREWYNQPYYMDSGILLGTKTLVELIRHYIRDTVRVFSVCHA